MPSAPACCGGEVDPADHRIVRLALSDEGEAQLDAVLSAADLEELRRLQAGLRLSAVLR